MQSDPGAQVNRERGLEDLAANIDDLVKQHPTVAEAWEISHGAADHLRLLAAFRRLSPAPGGAELDGLETSTEDRKQWLKRADDAGRLARDIDRIATQNAKLREDNLALEAIDSAAEVRARNAEAQIAKLEGEVEEARKVIEPFAKAAAFYDRLGEPLLKPLWLEGFVTSTSPSEHEADIEVVDFRAARDWLASLQVPDKQEERT